MRSSVIVACTMVTVTAIVGGYLWARLAPNTPEVILRARELQPALQSAATDACRCERRPGADKSECWAHYKTLARELPMLVSGAACFPVSPLEDCVIEGDDMVCVQTRFMYGGYGPDERVLCTPDEVALVEGARKAAERAGDRPEDVQKAGDAVADAIVAGRHVEGPRSRGCA